LIATAGARRQRRMCAIQEIGARIGRVETGDGASDSAKVTTCLASASSIHRIGWGLRIVILLHRAAFEPRHIIVISLLPTL
jgi:hypothetical protein